MAARDQEPTQRTVRIVDRVREERNPAVLSTNVQGLETEREKDIRRQHREGLLEIKKRQLGGLAANVVTEEHMRDTRVRAARGVDHSRDILSEERHPEDAQVLQNVFADLEKIENEAYVQGAKILVEDVNAIGGRMVTDLPPVNPEPASPPLPSEPQKQQVVVVTKGMFGKTKVEKVDL